MQFALLGVRRRFANTTKNLTTATAGPFDLHLSDVLQGNSSSSVSHVSIITARVFTQNDVLPPPGVPEPGTVLLSLGGILGLMFARRSKRQ